MKDYTQHDEVQGLLDYINKAPTPYHSTEYLAAMLEEAGAVRLKEEDPWGEILPGMIYYFTRNDSSLAAFRLSDSSPLYSGWRIGGAHHDAPGFRIKPRGSSSTNSYERLLVETYGGLIQHTWLDRPLSLAGRVYTKSGYSDGIAGVNINVDRPLLVIPSLAIHMDRGVNENAAFNPQTELLPLFSQDQDSQDAFMSFVAEQAAVDEDDVLSFDLMPYDANPACLTGLSNEFISAPRLDDYAMAYSMIRGFIESSDGSDVSSVAAVFDHEEIGSGTDRGARSNMIESVIERISEKLGFDSEEKFCSLSRSVILSADMAHAAHPAYPGKSDPNHNVQINKGPVLKTSAGQSYITSPRGSAFFRKMCLDNGIPFQEFVNRSDSRGGGTIGPMMAAKYGALSIDVGSPMLAMHSARELSGALDVFNATAMFEAFYNA